MSDAFSIIPLLLLVVIFYLLVLRPARKRQREFVAIQESLRPGQRVMLASGIFGTITALRDDEADLEIAPGTVVTVNRHAVAKVDEPAVDGTDPRTDTGTDAEPDGR